jgi:hypothetical protein
MIIEVVVFPFGPEMRGVSFAFELDADAPRAGLVDIRGEPGLGDGRNKLHDSEQVPDANG